MPFFSIIIPAYNAEATIRESLDSIVIQDFEDLEIIVVNDGSSDKTLSVIGEWQKENAHLQLNIINQENQGLGASRRTGIQKSSGKYIALLDADDIWTKGKLREAYQYIGKQRDVKILYHRIKAFGNRPGYRERKSRHLSDLRDLLVRGNPIIPSTVIIERETAMHYPFPNDKKFAEDIYVWIELLKENIPFHFIDKSLTLYREDGGMSTNIPKHYKCIFAVYEHFYHKNYFDKDILLLAKRRKYYEAGRFYHKRKMFSEAREYYKLAKITSVKDLFLWLALALKLAV